MLFVLRVVTRGAIYLATKQILGGNKSVMYIPDEQPHRLKKHMKKHIFSSKMEVPTIFGLRNHAIRKTIHRKSATSIVARVENEHATRRTIPWPRSATKCIASHRYFSSDEVSLRSPVRHKNISAFKRARFIIARVLVSKWMWNIVVLVGAYETMPAHENVHTALVCNYRTRGETVHSVQTARNQIVERE